LSSNGPSLPIRAIAFSSTVAEASCLAAATSSSSTLRRFFSRIVAEALARASSPDRFLSFFPSFPASCLTSSFGTANLVAASRRRSAFTTILCSFRITNSRNSAELSSPLARADCSRSRASINRSSASFFFSKGTQEAEPPPAQQPETFAELPDGYLVPVHGGDGSVAPRR